MTFVADYRQLTPSVKLRVTLCGFIYFKVFDAEETAGISNYERAKMTQCESSCLVNQEMLSPATSIGNEQAHKETGSQSLSTDGVLTSFL